MAHYSREEWKAFLEGTLVEEKSRTMEEYLLTCNECVGQYLSFFFAEGAAGDAAADNAVVGNAAANDVLELPPRFTSSVMKRIAGLEARQRGWAKRRDIFYYAAVACLTIFFMFAGVFEGFAGMIPKIAKADLEIVTAARSGDPDNRGIIEFGWSDKLMDSTLSFINTMKPKGEEVLD